MFTYLFIWTFAINISRVFFKGHIHPMCLSNLMVLWGSAAGLLQHTFSKGREYTLHTILTITLRDNLDFSIHLSGMRRWENSHRQGEHALQTELSFIFPLKNQVNSVNSVNLVHSEIYSTCPSAGLSVWKSRCGFSTKNTTVGAILKLHKMTD